MIHLAGVTMSVPTGADTTPFLRDITVSLPTHLRCAVFGGSPASRTHFLRLIGGKERPDKGEVLTQKRFSIIGNAGSYFHPGLTGLENITLCARCFGIDAAALTRLVLGFDAIDADWTALASRLPGKRRRSMEMLLAALLPYDCYLLDDIEHAPSECLEALMQILGARRAGLIFAAQNAKFARHFADCASVIQGTTMQMFEEFDGAVAFHG
jgi:capsular polysaccharide transport system ATP-binding protein